MGCLCSGSTGDFGLSATHELVSKFIKSRRQGLSPHTISYCERYLARTNAVIGAHVTAQHISYFIESLECTSGGKHAYYRALRAFYNWMYSKKSGYGFNSQDNPILLIESPKVGRRVLPSLTAEQANTLIQTAHDLRDKCIISLLGDSRVRLSELCSIHTEDIDWETNTVTIVGKGDKQRRAPFTERTAELLQTYLRTNGHLDDNVWGINQYGVQKMLKTLSLHTGIKCNPHAFRRGFACNLHRKGLSTLDIMHLGGWSDLSMVLRYTQSITFEDCLKHYKAVEQS